MNNVINIKDHRKPTKPKVMEQLRNYNVVELVDGTTIPITPNMKLFCLYNVEQDTLQFIEEYVKIGEDVPNHSLDHVTNIPIVPIASVDLTVEEPETLPPKE